ncbi:MAG TPA: hypothetical protein VFQ39_02385 [Longimicrobium sp.]|nr:hypothetical protein [Longimicrobium sp.]
MATIALDDLEVTSFYTDEAEETKLASKTYYTDCDTCEWDCICTADISTCSRTSVEGGCATDVQCVTVGC